MRKLRTARSVLLAAALALPAAANAAPTGDAAVAPTPSPMPDERAAARQAADAFAEGLRRVRAGEFAEAKSSFRRAYELQPHPVGLYNIGQCEARLGEWGLAIGSLERYLKEGTSIDPAQRAAVTRQLEELRARAQRSVETPAADAAPSLPTFAPSAPVAAQRAPEPPARHASREPLEPGPAARAWPWWVGGAGVLLLGSATALYAWNDSRYVEWKSERDALAGAGLASDATLWDRANRSNETLRSIRRIDAVSAAIAIVGAAGLGLGAWQIVAGDGIASSKPAASASTLALRATW